jgi:hypothetical protein
MNAYATVAQKTEWATEGGDVGHAAMGEMHEIAYVDLPPICAHPKGKLLSATMFKQSIEIEIVYNMYRMKPAVAYGPSQLCQVRARVLTA